MNSYEQTKKGGRNSYIQIKRWIKWKNILNECNENGENAENHEIKRNIQRHKMFHTYIQRETRKIVLMIKRTKSKKKYKK